MTTFSRAQEDAQDVLSGAIKFFEEALQARVELPTSLQTIDVLIACSQAIVETIRIRLLEADVNLLDFLRVAFDLRDEGGFGRQDAKVSRQLVDASPLAVFVPGQILLAVEVGDDWHQRRRCITQGSG